MNYSDLMSVFPSPNPNLQVGDVVFDKTKSAPHELYYILSIQTNTIEIKSLADGNIKVTSKDAFADWGDIPEMSDDGTFWN